MGAPNEKVEAAVQRPCAGSFRNGICHADYAPLTGNVNSPRAWDRTCLTPFAHVILGALTGPAPAPDRLCLSADPGGAVAAEQPAIPRPVTVIAAQNRRRASDRGVSPRISKPAPGAGPKCTNRRRAPFPAPRPIGICPRVPRRGRVPAIQGLAATPSGQGHDPRPSLATSTSAWRASNG